LIRQMSDEGIEGDRQLGLLRRQQELRELKRQPLQSIGPF
jgi:hypothetical protein